jgi:tetratricopeptide (TPR) repeat protein
MLLLLLYLTPLFLFGQPGEHTGHFFYGGNGRIDNRRATTVSGSVVAASSIELSDLHAELHGEARTQSHAESIITKNGSFHFPHTPPGIYEIRISNRRGKVLGAMWINSTIPKHWEVRISSETNPSAESISIHRLLHKVPKAAQKKHQAAQKAHRRQEPSKAIALLEEALRLDPEYFEALATLGAIHLLENNPSTAIPYLQRAHKMDAGSQLVAANLAAAYLWTGDAVAARQTVSACLGRNPQFDACQRILRTIQAAQ